MTDGADDPLRQLRADIAARLRGICSHLTADDFDQLVTDIALMRVRFEVLEDLPGGLRPLRPKGEPEAPANG